MINLSSMSRRPNTTPTILLTRPVWQNDIDTVTANSVAGLLLASSLMTGAAAEQDSVHRGENPVCDHLNSEHPYDTLRDIESGMLDTCTTPTVAVYIDDGITDEMMQFIAVANSHNWPVEHRTFTSTAGRRLTRARNIATDQFRINDDSSVTLL